VVFDARLPDSVVIVVGSDRVLAVAEPVEHLNLIFARGELPSLMAFVAFVNSVTEGFFYP
jgi:hypothetical protein